MAIGRKQWINFWRLGSFDDESERARFQTTFDSFVDNNKNL